MNDLTDLTDLGFAPFFQQQWNEIDTEDLTPARVFAEHRGAFELVSATGTRLARLSGRLRAQGDDPGALPSAGDWVAARIPEDERAPATIERTLARRSVFTRGAAGRGASTQVIAANVDCVFVVCGLDADYNVRRIERMVARVWAGGAQPTVVLNKSDLCDDAEDRAEEVRLACPGVDVLVTCGLTGDGIPALAAAAGLPGKTGALVGSSGAGKSTILNALLGDTRFETAPVREHDHRGKHTTTHRQLVRLPAGGLMLDTPGMREFALTDEAGLERVFSDIEALATGCRFADCAHEGEPGCAVRSAVEAGDLSADRLDAWHKLQKEARANALRADVRLSRQAGRRWGALHDEGRMIRRLKGDD
jgi:ribosome biogenesis GTPase